MKRFSLLLVALFAMLPGSIQAIGAQLDAEQEAAYTRTLETRSADIIKLLNLSDTNRSAQVHDAIIAHYRWLRSWQEAHEPRLKQLERTASGPDKERAAEAQTQIADVRALLKPRHEEFIAKLAANLTPEQVDTVKDKMTYNLVKVTYDAFCDLLPNLTAEQKARILDWLKDARELAVDGVSSDEKHAIFGKYKGRINNYLSAQGYDLKKASDERNARNKARSAK